MTRDSSAPLLGELRWFIVQRWFAGCLVILGTVLSLGWMPWGPLQTKALAVGIGILLYNLLFRLIFWKRLWRLDIEKNQRRFAWTQVTLDLGALTLLVALTGGILSPLVGLFVLHMIFASLLLQPPQYTPYVAWVMAVVMMGGSLWLTDQWPGTPASEFLALGWAGTLLLTVYITIHITNDMRASHDRTRAVLAAAPDGVLTIDHAGRIELANPEALRMFGYTPSEMLSKRIDQLVTHADLPHFADQNARPTPDTRDGMHPSHAIRKDGSSFPIELSINERSMGGQSVFTTVVHDITERKRTEAALHELNDELTKQQEQLIQHEKMIAVGQMAAGVAHEIANPLANMDGLIQLVERNPDRMNAELPNQLREQISRITHIVRQLKDFAHPTDSDRQVIAVDDLVKSALDMIRFDRRHHAICVDEQLNNPCCHVRVHLQSIEQVLVNLIINALDAERKGCEHRVSISSKCIDGRICCITIHDNGVGIPPDQLERIFEPFFTTKPLGKGTGLGLSISYTLIKQNGGQIKVQSEEGVGTSISIFFPVVECAC